MKFKELKEDLVDEMYDYFDTVHDKSDCDEKLDEFSDKLQIMLEAHKESILEVLENIKKYYFKLYEPESIEMYKSILKIKMETVDECIKQVKGL